MAYIWCAVRVISALCGEAVALLFAKEGRRKQELDGRWLFIPREFYLLMFEIKLISFGLVYRDVGYWRKIECNQ